MNNCTFTHSNLVDIQSKNVSIVNSTIEDSYLHENECVDNCEPGIVWRNNASRWIKQKY